MSRNYFSWWKLIYKYKTLPWTRMDWWYPSEKRTVLNFVQCLNKTYDWYRYDCEVLAKSMKRQTFYFEKFSSVFCTSLKSKQQRKENQKSISNTANISEATTKALTHFLVIQKSFHTKIMQFRSIVGRGLNAIQTEHSLTLPLQSSLTSPSWVFDNSTFLCET